MNQPRNEKVVDLKKIGAIIHKNFLVLTRDKARLFPLILFPVFMILIFGYTSGNIPKHIPVSIVDNDNSQFSMSLIQAISEIDVMNVRYMVSTDGEAKKLLDSGKTRAIIVIPPNMENDYNNRIPTHITLTVDESDTAISSTIRKAMASIVHRVAAESSWKMIVSYQQIVKTQTDIISHYATESANQYSTIMDQLVNTPALLSQARMNMDKSAGALIESLGTPSVFIPPDGATKINANDTIVLKPIGYDTAQSQIALFQQTSSLITGAANSVEHATAIAYAADRSMEQHLNSVDKNLNVPAAKISEFTSADAETILIPVQLQEKPAYGTGKRAIDFLIANIIALTIFQGAIMGMGRSVAGEKRDGSLTRVFLTPTSNMTIILGTLLFYIIFEIFRSSFLLLLSIMFFSIAIEGSLLAIAVIIMIYAGVSTAIGMIISSMVRTEQQYMAMSMLVSMPTIFLAGLFFPLQAMPKVLQVLAKFLPITYAGQALNSVMTKGLSIKMAAGPVFILIVFLIVIVGILFAVFKRDIE